MVSFRFYVVSTVAFFLALSVGVVVGSVLDGRIADSLQDRLDGVEQSLDETVAAIDAKNDQIDEMERYIDESAPFAVTGRLTGTATLVTAETGVEPGVVEDLVRRLRQAGSRVEGVIWLDRRLALDDPADRQLVTELTGLPASTSPEGLRSALWSALIGAASGAEPSEMPGTTTEPTPQDPDGSSTTTTTTITTAPPTTTTPGDPGPGGPGEPVQLVFGANPLRELGEAGLVRLQSIEGDATTAATELLVASVSSAASTAPEPGLLTGEVATASASAGVPTLLAASIAPEDSDEDWVDAERDALIAIPAVADSSLISTVNNLELVPGRVASVLALADLREGRAGRYGLGPDVDGILPPWQGP